MRRKHRYKVRRRAFRIWQVLGYSPWKSEWTVVDDASDGKSKGFYKGAFNSIPFLNDDAKRTFVHLLLRPGYMIRDYLHGKHDTYLAPLTSLIIFYAFFSLVVSMVKPDFTQPNQENVVEDRAVKIRINPDSTDIDDEEMNQKLIRLLEAVDNIDVMIHLDSHPEKVDSPQKASLAAFESAVRSQGIHIFLFPFIILWLVFRVQYRKRSIGWSAAATISAYVQCQFCFFMMFALLLSWGKSTEIGVLLMGLLLMFDFRQLFGLSWKKSLVQVLITGLYVALLYLILFVIILAVSILYFV